MLELRKMADTTGDIVEKIMQMPRTLMSCVRTQMSIDMNECFIFGEVNETWVLTSA